jgi:hypothetical protein
MIMMMLDNERNATGKQKNTRRVWQINPHTTKINNIRKTSSIEISKEKKLMKLIPKITHTSNNRICPLYHRTWAGNDCPKKSERMRKLPAIKIPHSRLSNIIR